MTLEELKTKTLMEMKMAARNLGMKGFGPISTREKMLEKIEAHMAEHGLTEIPEAQNDNRDITAIDEELETQVEKNPDIKPKTVRRRIDSFPRKKVIVLSRDPNITEYPFGINEYTCVVQMNKPVLLPEPIIELIKSTTEVVYRKDNETGFTKHEEVSKFVVQPA